MIKGDYNSKSKPSYSRTRPNVTGIDENSDNEDSTSYTSPLSFKSTSKRTKYAPPPLSLEQETELEDYIAEESERNENIIYNKNVYKKGTLTCLVLDLDETLIHTWKRDDPRLQKKAKTQAPDRYYEFKLDDNYLYWGVTRPDVADFLKYDFRHFDIVGIWTAATSDYAEEIKKRLEELSGYKFHFVWSRDMCTLVKGEYIKPLARLFSEFPDIDPDNTLMLDDKRTIAVYNPKNLLQIQPYDPKDPLNNDVAMTAGIAIFRNMFKIKKEDGISLRAQDKSKPRWGGIGSHRETEKSIKVVKDY